MMIDSVEKPRIDRTFLLCVEYEGIPLFSVVTVRLFLCVSTTIKVGLVYNENRGNNEPRLGV